MLEGQLQHLEDPFVYSCVHESVLGCQCCLDKKEASPAPRRQPIELKIMFFTIETECSTVMLVNMMLTDLYIQLIGAY